jgi:hypothetical protein
MCYVEVRMRRSPRNVKIAFSHAGLTHYGGILFFNEFSRMLQLRRFLTRRLRYPRRNHDYQLSQMILSLAYPIILGLDRLETASLLRSNGTFQYLTGLPTYPTPQSLRRFLLQAAPDFREQLHRVNDYLLQDMSFPSGDTLESTTIDHENRSVRRRDRAARVHPSRGSILRRRTSRIVHGRNTRRTSPKAARHIFLE